MPSRSTTSHQIASYLAATLVFIYLVNTDEKDLSTRRQHLEGFGE